MDNNKNLLEKLNPKYRNVVGLWKVTTEGDCEGKSTRDLGVWEGNVADIALYLAPKAMYDLCFKSFEIQTPGAPQRDCVTVSFDIDSNTWPMDMQNKERVEVMRELFADTDYTIEEGSSYASFTIRRPLTPEQKHEVAVQKVLQKLTPEERELLGY